MFIIYSLLLTGVAYRGEVDIFSGVCLFVCQSVCLSHDNFRTIKRRMTKLGGWVHCTKKLARVRMSRSKVKGQGHRGQKNTKKCGILFGSRPLGRGPPAACFSGVVLWGRGPLRRWENQRMLSSFV